MIFLFLYHVRINIFFQLQLHQILVKELKRIIIIKNIEWERSWIYNLHFQP